jgi:HNH endonuclease
VTERTFDYRQRIAELSCRATDWLLVRRSELVRQQRRLRVEELAVTAVLDARGALDETTAARDGISVDRVRERVETARALEELPAIAAAAYDGGLSDQQLAPLARLADEESDREWAQRGPHTAPADLERLARCAVKPTSEEAHARRAARELTMRWRRNAGMLSLHAELPDIDGALVENVLNDMIDRMRPAKGEPWAPRAQRGADALVELCRLGRDYDPEADPDAHLRDAYRPDFVVHIPPEGPVELLPGIPLPDGMVEALRAQARLAPVAVDQLGAPVVQGAARRLVSPKKQRAVKQRDGHCRIPGCPRTHGLQVHHLIPVTWGGSDDFTNLAAVCVGGSTDHHKLLVPHGPYLLIGNPNVPDGLRLVHRDQWPDIRAGPAA